MECLSTRNRNYYRRFVTLIRKKNAKKNNETNYLPGSGLYYTLPCNVDQILFDTTLTGHCLFEIRNDELMIDINCNMNNFLV